jgi:molybdopterin-guanine dinucleotide biosynthesis protein A
MAQMWTAVILTGGRSSRFGSDKSAAVVAGRPLLRRVLDAVPREVPVVLVGPVPTIPTGRPVTVVREDPPGGGPAAALAAALPHVRTEVLVALATDLPFLGPLPGELAAALPDGDDALLVTDGQGRDQPLLAAYRVESLRRAAASLGEPGGASMRALLAGLHRVARRPAGTTVGSADGTGRGPAWDIDTPQDLARARGALMLQDWIDAVRIDLGTTGELDASLVLDVAKDVAHNVQRPAAPLTTYLLGLAVGSGMPLEEAARQVRDLALGWRGEEPSDGVGAGGDADAG